MRLRSVVLALLVALALVTPHAADAQGGHVLVQCKSDAGNLRFQVQLVGSGVNYSAVLLSRSGQTLCGTVPVMVFPEKRVAYFICDVDGTQVGVTFVANRGQIRWNASAGSAFASGRVCVQ